MLRIMVNRHGDLSTWVGQRPVLLHIQADKRAAVGLFGEYNRLLGFQE